MKTYTNKMKTYTNYNVYNYRKYNKTIENEQWVYIYIYILSYALLFNHKKMSRTLYMQGK